jgi:aerobic carbon-monoxide dehydrogenase medium subunit
MKPAAFAYVRAESVEHVLELRASREATILAGGQSLLTMMNLRLARPALIVDIGELGELGRVFDDTDSVLLGAMVRQRSVETDPLLTHRVPLASQAMTHTAHVAVRNRGTVGGTLAHGDPSGELPLVAVVAGATLYVESRDRGRREIAAEDFFVSYYTTAIESDEMLTWFRIPAMRPGQGWGFCEHAPQHGAYAVAGAAALVDVDADGTVAGVRAGLLHAADRPLLVGDPADVVGTVPAPDRWHELARSWVRAVQPPENAEHIRAVAADALARSLCDAFERAVASTDPSPTQE